jgi:hypothetical protein
MEEILKRLETWADQLQKFGEIMTTKWTAKFWFPPLMLSYSLHYHVQNDPGIHFPSYWVLRNFFGSNFFRSCQVAHTYICLLSKFWMRGVLLPAPINVSILLEAEIVNKYLRILNKFRITLYQLNFIWHDLKQQLTFKSTPGQIISPCGDRGIRIVPP